MIINIDNKIIENASEEEKKLIEKKTEVQEQKKSNEEKSVLSLEVNYLVDEISNKIVGQDEAIKTLVSNIFYNQVLVETMMRDYHYDLAELDSRKVSILLDGPTGTGKTAILKEISTYLEIPIVFCNANSFSETGYVGPSITDPLRQLYKQASGKLSTAEKGIIVFDEIDKIASKVPSEKDMKKGVQEELLGFISGGIYDFPLEEKNFNSEVIHFDTSKLTFILSGAFTKLRERKIEMLNPPVQNPLGFTSQKTQSNNKTEYVITPQDYIDEGLHREFFGRIKVLTCTKGYNYNDLKRILLSSSISPYVNFKKNAEMFGYNEVIFDDEFTHQLCLQAIDMGTGARALQTIMSGVQNRLLYGMINHDYDLDKPLVITTDLLKEYNRSLVRKI